MRQTEIPIGGGFYRSPSLPLDAQNCVNAYPVIVQISETLTRQSLFATPGLKLLASSGAGANRGSEVMDGVPYFVQGNFLYSLDRTVTNDEESFSTTEIGFISGLGNVSMAENGTQLMILVPGGTGYIYDGTSLVEITDTDFTANGNPQYVTFVDGYFACVTDSKKFIVSALNDGTSWNALDVGSAEIDPDAIMAAEPLDNILRVFGTETTESFQNIGGSGFPFQRIPGSAKYKGLFARFSLISMDDQLFWVGGGKHDEAGIWRMAGNQIEKVSTDAVDQLLQELTADQLDDVNGWSYSDQGQFFVGWNLENTTIVYSLTTSRWHERKSRTYDVLGYPNEKAWRCRGIVRAYDRIIGADRINGNLGEVDLDTFDEYGNEVLRYGSTQPFENIEGRFSVPLFELHTEAGVGNSDTPDPQLRVAFSRDGVTYGPERSRSLGKVGERNKRQVWRMNGTFDYRAVMRWAFSGKTKLRIIKASAGFA